VLDEGKEKICPRQIGLPFPGSLSRSVDPTVALKGLGVVCRYASPLVKKMAKFQDYSLIRVVQFIQQVLGFRT
jgi:hypothetical protein